MNADTPSPSTPTEGPAGGGSPEYVVAFDSLCQRVTGCTCGTGASRTLIHHEPGCGLEFVASLREIFDALSAQHQRDREEAALDSENLRLREQAGEMAEEIMRLRGEDG